MERVSNPESVPANLPQPSLSLHSFWTERGLSDLYGLGSASSRRCDLGSAGYAVCFGSDPATGKPSTRSFLRAMSDGTQSVDSSLSNRNDHTLGWLGKAEMTAKPSQLHVLFATTATRTTLRGQLPVATFARQVASNRWPGSSCS